MVKKKINSTQKDIGASYTEVMPQERKNAQSRRRVAPSKGDQRERAILEAAERQLAGGGVDGMTVETIATAAGITRGALYFYFGSKHAVLTALVDRTISGLLADLDRVDADASDDPKEILRQSLVQTARMWDEHGSVMRLAVELSPSVPEIDELWQRTVTSTVDTLCPVMIRAGLPPGDRTTDTTAVTRALVWMTERSFYQASRRGLPLAEVAETLSRVWVRVADAGTRG
jgi:AcrR family transcriptional regulator